MSELSASHCGCNQSNNLSDCGCGNNWIWIILLLFCCGGNNGIGFSNGCGCDNNGCNSWIWIILLLCCCGGNNNGCGCGC